MKLAFWVSTQNTLLSQLDQNFFDDIGFINASRQNCQPTAVPAVNDRTIIGIFGKQLVTQVNYLQVLPALSRKQGKEDFYFMNRESVRLS